MATATNKKAVGIYLLCTLCLSSIFYFLIIYTGKLSNGFGLYVTGIMWSPGLSALITCKLLKRDFSTLGWQWGKARYQWWSYAVPILYALAAYLIIWLCGFGGFYNQQFVNTVTTGLGLGHLPDWLAITIFTVLTGIYGMVGSSARALGEEIGWRGFLTPELYKSLGYVKTSLLVGIIWSLWHYPILIFADYNSGTPAWYGLTCFTVMVTSSGFIYTWFRMRSGSLWTGVLLHASHNLFIQAVFTRLTSDTGNTKYFIDEFGCVLPLVSVVAAIVFYGKRKELEGVG
jgi:membrane protease YdiL (CAAX protease family)